MRQIGRAPGWCAIAFGVLQALSLACASSAFAQADRAQNIRVVVGFSPGGGIDVLARLMAQKISVSLGVPAVVDNVTGAGGNIAAAHVAKSPPNGSTLLFVSSAHVMNPAIDPNVQYDPINDFSPIMQMSRGLNVIVVHPSLGVSTLQEFIKLAKQKPGGLFYGSGGIGTTSHMATELLKSFAGIDVTHVPYKGAGPYLRAMLSGEIQLSITGVGGAAPNIRSGKVVPLAVTALQRSEKLPDVPTASEAGVPGYEFITWQGFLAPARTPPEIVQRIRGHMASALAAPDLRARLEFEGYTPVGSTPQEFGALLKRELDTWTSLVKTRGIKAN